MAKVQLQMFKTADLCDAYGEIVHVASPVLTDFGGIVAFHGTIVTIVVDDDHVPVREMLSQPGNGRVLVVDNGGSLACAVLGDHLTQLAIDNEWAGIVVNGCVRDSAELHNMPIGIQALATCPRRSERRSPAQTECPVNFAAIEFKPGAHLYADDDGLIVADQALQTGDEPTTG